MATATYSDGSMADVTTQATWSSTSSAVLQVGESTGIVTAIAAGYADVVATFDGQSGMAMAVVGGGVLVSITVTPPDAQVAAGQTQQFMATTQFSDGESCDGTARVTWQSSVPGIASIAAGGLSTAVTPGGVTISATADGVLGEATLTVTGGAADGGAETR
jgi:uncharacterized protein YjdB